MAILVAIMGVLFGAVQLLPSLEYGPLSSRWVGGVSPMGFHNKVPYAFLGTTARFSPRSLFTFLFAGANPGDEFPTNYFGVLPFMLSVVGAWRGWRHKWVKYFAAVALFSYLYTWGEFSFLHGVLYLVPGLDVAREAGRFILLTHFAGSILAGYGVDAVFGALAPKDQSFRTFVRSARWLVVFLAAILMAGSLQTTIAVEDSLFMSFVFIAAAYVIFELLYRDYRSSRVKGALVFLIIWDLYAFNSPVRNKQIMVAAKQDHMAELIDTRKLAEFFRSQHSAFRIHFDATNPPNIGNSYGVPMTGGMSATMLADYFPYLGHAWQNCLTFSTHSAGPTSPDGNRSFRKASGVCMRTRVTVVVPGLYMTFRSIPQKNVPRDACRTRISMFCTQRLWIARHENRSIRKPMFTIQRK
jgi:hypothetical protein